MPAYEESFANVPVKLRSGENSRRSLVTQILDLVCSVRLGVSLLVLLGLACLIGMLVMQQNVDGFSNYYQALTPAQRLVYGKLGFFDIYHAWYFNALLGFLSLNIILSSIERFPKAWRFFSKPNKTVPVRWLKDQRPSVSITFNGERSRTIDVVMQAMIKAGWRKPVTTERGEKTFVFAQSGVWNRLGAYAVHVALLTIFLGGFLTAQLGTTGQLPLRPGESSDLIYENVVDLEQVSQITKQLPFEIMFTDIEQTLIKKEGPITAGNTIDWITRFTIKDESGTHDAMVQMNRPFDYRGYRFFQASFVSIGRARNITVRAFPADGRTPEDVVIPRNGISTLADGTKIKFDEFRGSFRIGTEDPNEDTTAYQNPGAILKVIAPNSTPQSAYAFNAKMANAPVAAKPVGGYTYQLVDFEKVSDQHILSIQRDPGANVVYIGFLLLFLTLSGVFFFSHQRVWAVIEEAGENRFTVILGGNANRNQNGFGEKFSRFAVDLRNEVIANE